MVNYRSTLRIATLVCLVSCSPTLADDQYDACIGASDGTNAAWSDCGVEWLDREDRRLNAAWTLLTPKLEPETKASLLDEQRAWIAFKDKSCLFYSDGTFGSDGSVLHFPQCRAGIVAQRAEELRAISEFMDPL